MSQGFACFWHFVFPFSFLFCMWVVVFLFHDSLLVRLLYTSTVLYLPFLIWIYRKLCFFFLPLWKLHCTSVQMQFNTTGTQIKRCLASTFITSVYEVLGPNLDCGTDYPETTLSRRSSVPSGKLGLEKNSAPTRRIFVRFYTTDLLKRVERIHIR
jgi:hypothetical protein